MYELVDFGDGRKLERVAGRLLNRPCPAADARSCCVANWPEADATFHSTREQFGRWRCPTAFSGPWHYRDWFGSLELSLSPFGHIGVFPEQRDSWNWIRARRNCLTGCQLLNLFAYTGGSTLAALAVNARVTHVDSARNMVARARSNAVASGWAERPVRWIVEDAKRFVDREVRRGNRYDGVILDPPSFGRGVSKGQRWEIDRDLPLLLEALGQLVPDCQVMLCTCHSPGFTPKRLANMVGNAMHIPDECEAGEMILRTRTGQSLPAGICVRWCRSS